MLPFNIGFPELVFVGIIALLLFGKRLPEVARSLGKGVVEFKKGLSGIEDEVHSASYSSNRVSSRPQPDDSFEEELSAPKFEPPRSAPTESTPDEASTPKA